MSSVNPILDRLIALDPPSLEAIQEVLGLELTREWKWDVLLRQPREPKSFLEYIELPIANGPFELADVRINDENGFTFLVLHARRSGEVRRADLDLDRYGEPAIKLNPHVGPEGVEDWSFSVEGRSLMFEFDSATKKFLVASIEWPASA